MSKNDSHNNIWYINLIVNSKIRAFAAEEKNKSQETV